MTTKTMVDVADKAIDKVETFVGNVASTATNIFEAASGIVTTAIEKYGEKAVDAVLWVVRIDALQPLITGWLIFIAAIALSVVTYKTIKRYGEMVFNFGPIILVPIPLIIALFALSVPKITDVWLYTAIAKPELYLAKQVVEVVKTKFSQPSVQVKGN